MRQAWLELHSLVLGGPGWTLWIPAECPSPKRSLVLSLTPAKWLVVAVVWPIRVYSQNKGLPVQGYSKGHLTLFISEMATASSPFSGGGGANKSHRVSQRIPLRHHVHGSLGLPNLFHHYHTVHLLVITRTLTSTVSKKWMAFYSHSESPSDLFDILWQKTQQQDENVKSNPLFLTLLHTWDEFFLKLLSPISRFMLFIIQDQFRTGILTTDLEREKDVLANRSYRWNYTFI